MQQIVNGGTGRRRRPAMRPSGRGRPTGWKVAVLGSAAALVVAGCGTSDSGQGGTASGEGGSGGATAAQNSTVVSYIGGKAGPADDSLAPVTIGFINQQGGPVAAPEASDGADAAVEYINKELGGIKGHPLKLSTCYIVSQESEGQKCGQQFVNDPKIPAVVMGFTITGNASFFKVINGSKPVIGSIAISPVALAAENTYFLNGTANDGYEGLVAYAKSKGYKSITVANDNSPSGQVTMAGVKKVFGDAGITVHPAQFPPGSSSVVGPLVAAGAQQTDALGVFSTTNECITIGKAIQQLNLTDKPVLSTPTCIDPSVKEAFGDLPKWTYTVSVNSFDTEDPQVALYLDKFKQYAKGDTSGGWAGPTFQAVLTTAKMLNEAGGPTATSSAIAAKMKAFQGPVFLGPTKLGCGSNPAAPASCLVTSKVQTYQGNGKWVTNGNYPLPKG